MLNSLISVLLFCFVSVSYSAGMDTDEDVVDSLVEMMEEKLQYSDSLSIRAYYPESYDVIWEVLSVADSLDNARLKSLAYKKLAMLYSVYYDKTKALASIDSMFYYAEKPSYSEDMLDQSSFYYTAAITYRMNEEYDDAMHYLDSAELFLDSLNRPFYKRIYVVAERAHLCTLTGDFAEAQRIFNKISNTISLDHDYTSILYSMWGDMYLEQGSNRLALEYYNKCLATIEHQDLRVALKVDLLEKISQLNNDIGNYQLAYSQMTESKALGDSLFGSQSMRNRQLFEIKDSYRTAKIANQAIQREQDMKILKAEKEKLNQELIFLIILFVLALISSIVVARLLKRKHRIERNLAEERSRSELEVKKKELTVTALQLIEKDKLLKEVKEGLKQVQERDGDDSIERIKSTIKVNTAKTWEEFEARFVQVNGKFNEALSAKHPDLSRNELKLCALIKLNFSTKEMADLLGVSADSVNKARYRLRKKLLLKRDDNLVTYINGI